MLRNLIRIFLFSLIILRAVYAGTVYYVDRNNGNDSNNGLTLGTAWKTIGKANNTLGAGDTVYIRGGTYIEDNNASVINPINSGSAGNYIKYQNYNGERVVIAGCSQPITFHVDHNYIWVEGIEVDGNAEGTNHLIIGARIRSSYNVIKRCEIHNTVTSDGAERGIWIENGTSHNQILDNNIHHIGILNPPNNCHGDGIISDDGTSYNLIQGNTVGDHCGHGSIGFWGNYNIIRNNTIIGMEPGVDNPDHFEGHQVFEKNVITDITVRGSLNLPRGGIFVNSPKSIIRRNVFSNLAGSGFVMFSDSNNSPSYSRIYHNVVYKAGQVGDDGFDKAVEFTEAIDGTMVGIVVKDNIFHDNYADGTAWRDYANPGDHVVTNNHWMANGDPLFRDEANCDFQLIYGSPCIDGGEFLTRTKQGGSGTQLSVEDASYFMDGFGIVEGDLIQLEGQTPTARITTVDYTNNIITVDKALTWYVGQGVTLAYSISSPDIGAFEYDGANPLTATITASPTSGSAPLIVNFTGSATGGTAPYTYRWTFGDGSSSAIQNPSHTYSTTGNYTATLTVTDSQSATNSKSLTISVTAAPAPLAANASASPSSGQAPLAVNFTGSASGGTEPYTYRWTFGDSASSTTQNPAHNYSTAGNYTATLTVTDSQSATNSRSLTISVTAAPSPLAATASASPSSGQAPLAVSFTGSASGGTAPYSYRWTFGDSGSSTLQNPSHTYSTAGNYTATLTVTDSQTSTNSKSLTINVTTASSQLIATAAANPTSGVAPLVVNFTGSASGGTAPYTYRWTFGDSGSSTSQNPTHTYSTAGNYTATLTVTDSQSATNTKSLTISVTAAASQLAGTASANPTSGLAPLTVNFTGSATGGTAPYTYRWNFGDGSSSTTQNPSHTYSAIGNYTATFIVTDSTSANANSAVNIAVQTTSAASLSLVAETGAPAPGQGGTTDPPPGNHSYSIGSTVQVRSVPNTDYRFSKWAGDIAQSSIFGPTATITMDNNKSLSGTFCTKCGDVNGDLKITPADAQLAFDIYLGRIANPTWCELENGDVKCDGTKLSPKITPADAQHIFHQYLRKQVASSDCSGASRAATTSMQNLSSPSVKLTINNITYTPGKDILISVIIESPSDVKAFGFDLAFPSNILTYVGLESTDLTYDFDQLGANVISYQIADQGGAETEPSQGSPQPFVNMMDRQILRVGGYKTNSTQNPSSGILVTLIFRASGEFKGLSSLSVIATYDDIRNAAIKNESANLNSREYGTEYKRPVRQPDRKIPGKRYDF